MAKSDITMSPSEMTAELADMDPRGKGGGEPDKPEPRAKDRDEPTGDDIEYVGPEAGGDDQDELGKDKTPDKAAKDGKAKDGDGKGKPDPAKKPEAKTPDGFVPHSALHAEREEHKKTRAEVAALRQSYENKFNVILGELTKASQERQAPAKEEPAPPPDPEQDPIGHQKWLNQQIADVRGQLTQRQQQDTQQTQQQRAVEWYRNAIDVAERSFAAQAPDYYNAATFLRESRMRELWPLYNGDLAAVSQVVDQEAMQYTHAAIQQGQNPAAWFYEMARQRGYAPKAADGSKEETGNGHDPDEKPNGKAMDGAAEIERLAKAQDAGNPLSEGGGGAPGGTRMSFDSFDRMSQKEIEAWVRTATKKGGPDAVNKALARMMGAGR